MLPQRPIVLALARASSHPLSRALRVALEGRGVNAAALDDLVRAARLRHARHLARTDGEPRPPGRSRIRRPAFGRFHDGRRASRRKSASATQLRPDAVATIRTLDRLGIPSSIASGDKAAAVAPVALALGLTAQTAMRPEDKIDADRPARRRRASRADGRRRPQRRPRAGRRPCLDGAGFGERRRPDRRRRGVPGRQPRARSRWR